MKTSRWFSKLSIRDKFLTVFLICFIPLASIGSAILYQQVKSAIQTNIESELRNTSAIIRNMVRTAAGVSIRNRLRAIAEKNLELAHYLYAQYTEGQISHESAVSRIREILLSQTIGKTGYIYCIDSHGTAVVHPKSGVENKNFADFEFIQEQIRKKEGYIEYDWKNPGERKARPKATYMTYFEPLDWIISVSTYRGEFLELVDIDDFRSGLLSIKFGVTGYPYIADDDGNVILHPQLEGANIFKSPNMPTEFYREMLRRKNGRIRYTWKNPDDERPREKLVFFSHLPEYGWIVASSSYIDEVFAPLYRVRNVVLAALAAALLVVTLITFLLTNAISRTLKALMNKFAEGEKGDFSVRMTSESEDELGQLARYFNSFMERLNAYSDNLNQEIRERRQTAEALRESETRYRLLYEKSRGNEALYRSLLDAAPDAIVVYDMAGCVRFLNPSFTKIFGWTFDEAKGKPVPYVPETERNKTLRIIGDLIENGTQCRGFETRRYTKSGDVLELSVSAARYQDHQGSPTGMVVVLRDISDTKRLEAQIRHSQRMESIGTLAGGIAHDFNNLLMGIQGRISLISLDLAPDHRSREHLRAIEDHIQSATNLTRQLLGIVRGGKYEVKPLDANELVQSSAGMFARTRKELRVHVATETAPMTVQADRSQLEQVLLNLYVNAWQAMPDGGELRLETGLVILDDAFCMPHAVKSGSYVKISVTDTGSGMDESTQQRIFDPFFTTKEKGRGTGLGLASAYGIINNHGGIITVYSEIGLGTTFNLFLPFSDRQALPEKPKVSGAIQGGSETILLIDDEEMITDVGQAMLESLGYRVIVANDGEQAVETVRNSTGRIDLVILDMIMPGIDGGKTFDRIHAIRPSLPVLLSSGYSIDGQASSIIQRGCNGFIQKPFNLSRLSVKVRQVLSSVTTS